MAENDSTGAAQATIDEGRLALACDAAGELEDLFMAMLDIVKYEDCIYRQQPVVRAFAARGLALARAAMSALGETEDVRPTSELEEVVHHG